MSKKAKYKVGQEVEFYFAGSPQIGEIVQIQEEPNRIKYSVIDNDGTKYPVEESKVIRKV